MKVEDLEDIGPGARIETDIVIVGGGAVGLTMAREFAGASTRVLVLESGGAHGEERFAGLNTVENVGEPSSEAQKEKRVEFHGWFSDHWRAEEQAYGVRYRGLGGSTRAWAGKSAAFDEIDFAARDWVPNSGWPIGRATLLPYLDRAAEVMNLGPNCYDEKLWDLMGVAPPAPALDAGRLRPFFWQFARSRLDPMDIMRFGPEFLTLDASNIRVLVNATATRVILNDAGDALDRLEISTLKGRRSEVTAKACVIAAGGIENARLLLVSGLGKRNDMVGRCLMDHPSARVGYFPRASAQAISERFGFYGLRHGGRTHMYMHGLAPSPELQAREGLLNSAVYMLEDRAPDDPWSAVRRLVRRESANPLADVFAIARSPGLLVKGAAMKLFQSNLTPDRLRRAVVDLVLRWNSNFAVREFQSRGLPHKLNGVFLDAICEQVPNPESRITLSDQTDALGVPLARIKWNIDDQARRTLLRMGTLVKEEFERLGLPAPLLAPWVAENRPQDAVIIDMAHTAGTTRMSADPQQGVVDPDCQVHGVKSLYVAGGSVFPTCGHANPTLMMAALGIRLADHLKAQLGGPPAAPGRTMAGPRVLLTGATGLIGRNVLSALVERGYQVRATYSRRPGAGGDVEWAHLDLREPQDLAGLVAGCEAVIHLAAELTDTSRMERVNVDATRELAAAAAAAGARYFGYASSIVVYGSPRSRVVDETTPLIDPERPLPQQYIADAHMWEYARTKVLSERALGEAAGDMHVDIYRPTVVADAKRLLESADWGRLRKILATEQKSNYVPVEDVVDAIVHLLDRGLGKDATPGVQAYNLCDDEAPTFRTLLAQAYARSADPRYRPPVALPFAFNALKTAKAGHAFSGRRPLGRLSFKSARLSAAGFQPRWGVRAALERALAEGEA